MSDSKKKYHEMKEELEMEFDSIIEDIKYKEIIEQIDLFKQKIIEILNQ